MATVMVASRPHRRVLPLVSHFDNRTYPGISEYSRYAFGLHELTSHVSGTIYRPSFFLSTAVKAYKKQPSIGSPKLCKLIYKLFIRQCLT